MTIPVWVLLGFAGWTILLLLTTIGVERWTRILTQRAQLTDFPADEPHGSPRYRRAMRAHANCIENLPVYGAVVIAIVATGLQSPLLDTLAIVLLVARIGQSSVHVLAPNTNGAVAVRFGFFFVQLIGVVWMGAYVALHGA